VWDTYNAELAEYRKKLAEWQAREAARQAAPQDGA
ncbi:MAG: oxidoreductase, partial [Pseudogulbenkiania sp.]|nr:oxidoreductase [Pseudogulbenkiania sp.]